MKAFRVSGKFRMGHNMTTFTMETVGDGPDAAKDRVLSTIGSRHRVDRHHVTVTSVDEIPTDQVTDPVVEKRLAMVK